MRTLVISAVNFTEGGPLTVLRDCVAAAADVLKDWRIVVMAHDASLIDIPNVEVMAFPATKTSWAQRLKLEWWGFERVSRSLDVDLWLSLHDVTPCVIARRQAVYCHNPAIFYRISWREACLEPKFLLFNKFYGLLYRTFIARNSHVIVQQEWLRTEFRKRFGNLPMVVAHPSAMATPDTGRLRSTQPVIFLYPALPRVFKNIEVVCEAAAQLHAWGVAGFEVRLTLDGSENRYARWLKSRHAATPGVRFIGRQSSEQMNDHYREASALVFPSRLETWGLPITEAKSHGLPIIAASAPYAHETVGTYDLVSFFPPDDPHALALQMRDMIAGDWQPAGNVGHRPEAPFAADWPKLMRMLTAEPEAATDPASTHRNKR